MIRAILRNCGVHPGRFVSAIKGWRKYVRDRDAFQMTAGSEGLSWGNELPMLTEWNEAAGELGTYFFQDQLVARWIHDAKPARHVDVGSRLDGFVGSLSVFREVEVLDIRPQPLRITNVRFHQLDLMKTLPEKWIACTDSLSCLHTIEHFGLGRYGDPIDPQGHLKGLDQLQRMVAPGGMFYLSTPVGKPRIEFNAHRIFAPHTLADWFDDGWTIESCAIIDGENRVAEAGEASVLLEYQGDLGVGIVAARRIR